MDFTGAAKFTLDFVENEASVFGCVRLRNPCIPIFDFPKVPRKLRKLSVLLDEPDESKTLATSASQVGCVGEIDSRN